MMSSLLSATHWTLERAMREWARTDEAVAASVRAADRRVLDAVRQAFVDHGFDSDEADLRANATFAAGIGFLHLSGQTAERPRRGAPGALPRPHARATDARPASIPKSMVAFAAMTAALGHLAGYQPRVRRPTRRARAGGRAAAPAARRHRRRTSSRRGSPTCWCPPATAACRRRGRRSSIRSAGWRTDARPARGPSASTPCTTG